VTEKGVYYYDSINSSYLSGQVGYVMKKVDDKDTLVHVVRNKAGEYFYQVDEYGAPYDARTNQDMTSLSDLRPQIVMAAELFHYDETTKIYSLSGRSAGVFGKYFSMNSQADPATIQMADRLLISLDDQGHLNSFHADSVSNQVDIYARYTVGKATLPFNPDSLTEFNPLSDFVGTYEGTIAKTDTTEEKKVTVVVSLDGVLFDGEATTEVSVKNGRLYFTAKDGTSYNLRNGNALYQGYKKVCDLKKTA